MVKFSGVSVHCGSHPMRLRSVLMWSSMMGVAACVEGSFPGAQGQTGAAAAGEGGSSALANAGSGAGPRPQEPISEQEIRAALQETENLTADSLIDRYGPKTLDAPSFSPTDVVGWDRVQGSSFALNELETEQLMQRGFVISARSTFPNFAYGYTTLYADHVPLYVSADSILFAMHRSYDSILEAIEFKVLVNDLERLLAGARLKLAALTPNELAAESYVDVDEYLTVALSLLHESLETPVLSGSSDRVEELYEKCMAAAGEESVSLFGRERIYDFSQLEPRSHYLDSAILSRYFRSMMWLGRTDFRLIETRSDGSVEFSRRQFEDALLVEGLVVPEAYRRIDTVVSQFVGEHDSMEPEGMRRLREALGIESLADAAAKDSADIEEEILTGDYGTQRIASQIMVNGTDSPLPLARSFTLFGQRYAIDSHVFSNVVYDRLPAKRMMPNPLDIAFAVLGNGQAASLLRSELETFDYASQLGAMRVLTDTHPESFWKANLYNRWLSALRELSPPTGDSGAGLPPTFRTEAWGRRLLNAQLASWAELRHDSLLYSKQSYTGMPVCEFPDAYVDPYPGVFEQIAQYAALGLELMASLELGSDEVWDHAVQHFDALGSVASTLKAMAEHERTGEPFTQDMLDFINETVFVTESGCFGRGLRDGWYPRLFFDGLVRGDSVVLDGGHEAVTGVHPTIADVHTQPTDELGAPVGRVLHVGTGSIRPMVVIAENCTGPRAYVGLVSSYYERITESFERLNDQDWEFVLYDQSQIADDVPWMENLVSR